MEEKSYEKYNHPGYVEPLKPETKYTSRKVQVDGITLYDSEAAFRRNFLRKHLKNTVDVVRFSYMMGKLAVKPVIGPMIRKSLEWHYRYIHTNSVVVPIEVAKDIIRNTTDIAVSPCVCRTVQGHCDNPINTCFGLNFYGQLKKKAGERSVSVDECLAVADMAHKNGLIAVIESCVQPYQDNLCFCCTCCCIKSRRKRYEACDDVVRVTGVEPARCEAREPKGDVTLVKDFQSPPYHEGRTSFQRFKRYSVMTGRIPAKS